ncbi:putative prophage protein [Escherichia coli]|nr:putative prophage protein [Escherichia coli]
MKKQEPIIYSGDLSTEEVFQWMRAKLDAQRTLQNLESERASLQERLDLVCASIETLTSQCQLTTFQLVRDPIQTQDDQQNSPDIG